MVTLEQLREIMPRAQNLELWQPLLAEAMAEFEIDSLRRQASFLAQIAHESGQLRYVRELASGAAYDTGRLAKRLGNTPEPDGDGQRYKGRGLIQITGQDNYRQCSTDLFGEPSVLLRHPELLEEPRYAARSAAWYWWSRGLNVLADVPNSFQTITRKINGGLNGYEDRLAYYERAQAVLS